MTLYALGALTIAKYRVHTGDDTTPGTFVSGALVEAEELLEGELRRKLASESRTEAVRIAADGSVYPPAYPITAATGLTIDGRRLVGATPDLDTFVALIDSWADTVRRATVTWTGGFTAADGDAPLPRVLEHALYDIARGLVESAPVPALVGASAASVGDVSVSWPVPTGGLDALAPGLTQRVGKYRNRLV